jgi:hypothetical protein
MDEGNTTKVAKANKAIISPEVKMIRFVVKKIESRWRSGK